MRKEFSKIFEDLFTLTLLMAFWNLLSLKCSLKIIQTQMNSRVFSDSQGVKLWNFDIFQYGNRKFKHGFHDVYGIIYKEEGIRGLYRGFAISCVGIFLYRGLYFGLHDSLKPVLLPENYNFMQGFALAYGLLKIKRK